MCPLPSSLTSAPAAYAELRALLQEAATLGSISALLNWDQETYMPQAAGEHRAAQMEALALLVHERRTSPKIGKLLDACEKGGMANEPNDPEYVNLREIRRDYERQTKLPSDLVAEIARTESQAQEAWKQARADNDFPAFAPWLEKIVALMRRKAECYAAGKPGRGELYDQLLDEYEPGATAASIQAVFQPLAKRLGGLVKELTSSSVHPDEAFLNVAFEPTRQHELGQFVLKAMGFDFSAGRLDVTTHPFCSGMAPGDTRLTTRYRGEKFTDALYGTMHEGGHGLYEQGLPKTGPGARFGEPLADSISLGIHESQSRMWENFVGRSREFWVWLLPHAQSFARNSDPKGPLDKFSVDDAYRAANIVKPSFIRVEADEATYNLHVMLRFELERQLLDGTLKITDLPSAWNRRFKELFGIEVPDNRRGCLQDVHWSFGLFGYFPTYTLGNLYAAQFWETINKEIPDLGQQMSKGDFKRLKQWLNTNIHRLGRRYRAEELCRMITGKALSAEPLMRHLEGKLKPIYKVSC